MAHFSFKFAAILASFTILFSSCSLIQKGANGSSPKQAILLDTIDFEISSEALVPVRPAPQIKADIKHLELNLSFDLPEKKVKGIAKLKISAYALPIDTILLDAKGFDIYKIQITQGDSVYSPDYAYDDLLLTIPLKKHLKRSETAEIKIDYQANPTSLKSEEGSAIQSNQGLYFINPNGTIEGKPIQVWSQGEPESNSCWFPSIDKPHEKFTQEIFLTIDTAFKSISNGKLVYSTLNKNGTRTDYWKQDLEHSNYLVMIAFGEFSEVKDHWKDLEVFYYVNKEYEPYALDIFGNTPEMISFYSDTLNFDYPWAKYHQVVVKDFVSGAMENTSAVIHGDFVQRTKRELIDNNHEDVIAHELFHHWFGDIVTCETWSQITLNEGFATYGEFLWKAYKYGDEEARYHFSKDLSAYLGEAKQKSKYLIRHHYNKIDDVFDSHSYQKGGRVLHMLRLEVGDELFFETLTKYLKKYQYKTAEIEDLRLVFEEVTGQDLNWFFDQWYHEKGHPEVNAEVTYSDSLNELKIGFTQTQKTSWPIFKMNVPIAIATGDSFEVTHFYLDQSYQELSLKLNEKPAWVSVDPFGDMLWDLEEQKDSSMLINELTMAPSFIARNRAMISLYKTQQSEQNTFATLAFDDPFWVTRAFALSAINPSTANDSLKKVIDHIALNDPKSTVRAQALVLLDSANSGDSNYIETFIKSLNDSSFVVVKYALNGLMLRNPCLAAKKAENFEALEEGGLKNYVSKAYALCGDEKYLSFFEHESEKAKGTDVFIFNSDFTAYAIKSEKESVYSSLVNSLSKVALYGDSFYARFSALQGLQAAMSYYDISLKKLTQLEEHDVEITDSIARLRNKKANLSALIDEAKELNNEGDGTIFNY